MCQENSDICLNTLVLNETVYNQLSRRSVAGNETKTRATLSIFAFDFLPSCPASLKAVEVSDTGICKTRQGWFGNNTSKTSRGWLGQSTYKTFQVILHKKSTLTKKTSYLYSNIIYEGSETFVCHIAKLTYLQDCDYHGYNRPTFSKY